MPSNARIGYGVIFKKGDGGSPETFTDYGLEVVSVNGIGFTRDAVDATHMQSSGAWREFIFGLKQQKPISLEFNWIGSTTGTIQTQLESATPLNNWQFLFPDASSLTTAAGLTDFSLGDMTPEGKMSASVIFTASGAPTWA